MAACYRCGKALPLEQQRVYSSWTRHHYCTDLDACQQRYERRLKTDDVFRIEQEALRAERLARVNEAHEIAGRKAAKRGR